MNTLNLKTMKNKFLLGLVISATLFTSCGEDGTADILITDNSVDNSVTNNTSNAGGSSVETIIIDDNITSNTTLDANNSYILNGPIIVKSGSTLTIPAGMTIRANKGTEVYLAVEQGAKIIAEGTPSNPIVFTSNAAAPNAGDWGGLILLGKAPINSVDGTVSTTATSEIANLPYGGSDTADNSGSLQYVRVEYSGGKVDGQSENNGISFYGVGNGTNIKYVQVFEGLDDGLEFFGGTVNASFVSVVNSDDDSIDWTEGYSGNLTDIHVKQNVDGDKAFECDGYNTDVGNNSSPLFFSKPTITNVTIEGLGSAQGKEAIRLRAGTQGIFANVLITGYAEGFDLDGDQGDNPTGAGVLSGDLKVNSVKFNDVTTNVKNDTGNTFTDAQFLTEDANATGSDFATWGAGWARQ
jgi:hypothetical protein